MYSGVKRTITVPVVRDVCFFHLLSHTVDHIVLLHNVSADRVYTKQKHSNAM